MKLGREKVFSKSDRARAARRRYACRRRGITGRRCKVCKACVARRTRIWALLADGSDANVLIEQLGMTGREADDAIRHWRAQNLVVRSAVPKPMKINYDDPNPVTCEACGARWHTAATCDLIESGGRRGLLGGSALGAVL